MDFKILLERITPALRAIARKNVLIGFYDQDDLYQQMCLHLWQKFSDGMPIGINESYIIRSCEFYLLNFLRKGRRTPSHFSMDSRTSEDGLSFMETIPYTGTCSSDTAGTNISIDEIKSGLLTQKERAVFDLLMKGNTAREAASILGISHVMVLKYKKNITKKIKSRGYQE